MPCIIQSRVHSHAPSIWSHRIHPMRVSEEPVFIISCDRIQFLPEISCSCCTTSVLNPVYRSDLSLEKRSIIETFDKHWFSCFSNQRSQLSEFELRKKCFSIWRVKTRFCQKRYGILFDWSVEREICKPVLNLDFRAHGIMEFISEFGTWAIPKTWSFHSRSCMVKTSFGHIPSIEQSKRDFFNSNYNIVTIFYGPSDKCKALYSVNCILVSKVNFIHLLCSMCWTGQELVLLRRVFLLLI